MCVNPHPLAGGFTFLGRLAHVGDVVVNEARIKVREIPATWQTDNHPFVARVSNASHLDIPACGLNGTPVADGLLRGVLQVVPKTHGGWVPGAPGELARFAGDPLQVADLQALLTLAAPGLQVFFGLGHKPWCDLPLDGVPVVRQSDAIGVCKGLVSGDAAHVARGQVGHFAKYVAVFFADFPRVATQDAACGDVVKVGAGACVVGPERIQFPVLPGNPREHPAFDVGQVGH